MRQFAAQLLHWNAQDLLIGTSRTKNIEDSAVGATIHSYRGANLIDLSNAVNQYRPLNLRSVCIVAGFNDHHYSCSHFIECYQVLLDIICYKLQPLIVVSPKIIATSNNELVNRKIYFMNLALHRFFQFYTVPLIISPYFFFSKSDFCRDGIHFSFYGNNLFTL